MEFTEFIDEVSRQLLGIKARLIERRQDADTGSWDLSFTKASATYRIAFERRAGTITLEKGQGSFIASTPMVWRLLDSRQISADGFDEALGAVSSFLDRFTSSGTAVRNQ